MALYALGDMHLSFAVHKPMDKMSGDYLNFKPEKIMD